MKVPMVRTLRGWEPFDDEAIRASRRWKPGEIAMLDLVKPRIYKNLKRYRALAKLIYENSEKFESDDQVLQYLKIRAGHSTMILVESTGEMISVANSIDYDTLDEVEFQEVWRRIIDIVCLEVIPGISETEIEIELLKCMGLAA